jgi:hypothetical protein
MQMAFTEHAQKLIRNIARDSARPLVALGNGETLSSADLSMLIEELERLLPRLQDMLAEQGDDE